MDGIEKDAVKRPVLEYPFGEDGPAVGEVVEIAPGIEWTRMKLPFALEFINVWILEDEDGWTIVDTGIPHEECREAWKALLGKRLTPEKPLKRVVVTHMHPDHVGAAGYLCHKYGAELYMSRLEYTTCRMLVSDTGRDAPKAGIDFYRAAGWSEEQIENYKERFGGFGKAVWRLPDSFNRVDDGDDIRMAGQDWKVVVGNGHSPEHVCLYCPALNIIISGDQLLPRISSNVSVHPTEPKSNPLKDWIQSCRKLMAILPEDVLVLPAHNTPFRGAHKRLQHLVTGHETAMKRLKRKMQDGPVTVPETFISVFGRAIKPEENSLATGEALSHINYLIAAGEVVAQPQADGPTRYALA